VSLVDVLPTLAELCNVQAPPLDGKSLAPQLRNPDEPRRETVFSEFDLQTPRAKYMIRRGEWKFTLRVNDLAELYDLKRDSNEMENLAAAAEQQARGDALREELFAWYRPPEWKAG
jgi:choline-sulfatase